MKLRPLIALTLIGFSCAGFFGHDRWQHMRRMSGQQTLSGMSCFQCHWASTAGLRWSKERPHHDAPASLAITPDGHRIFIALDDRNEVVEADTSTLKILRRSKVPGTPFGLALDSEGQKLFVTCRSADQVVVLDTGSLQALSSITVGTAPVAIAFCRTTAGDRLIVANSMSDDISVVATGPLREISRVSAGREPFAVAASADGSRAFVANRISNLGSPNAVPASEITEVDPASGRVTQRVPLESAHLSEGIAFAGSRGWVLTPLVKTRNLVPITQVANGWVMSSGVALTDAKIGRTFQLPLDEANDYFADPSGITIDPAGKRAFIASGGGDAITVLDLEKLGGWLAGTADDIKQDAINDLTLSLEYVAARIPTKRNPRHLALSPDGAKLFIAERLEDTVLVIDARSFKELGRIVLGDGGLNDPIRRGERVFSSAAYTFQRQFSCRSCHPDGHQDGLSYDFDGDGIGQNVVDNRSLLGVAGTAPFKWNGKNASLEIQCGPRFAKVLMRTEPFPKAELRDLVTFIESLPPPRSMRHAAGELTPEQERGRAIFFATKTPDGKDIPRQNRCDTCHRPPFYSVRLPFNVGTKGPHDSSDAFDTPHLLGVARTAPYLHDGRARTLEEIWTIYSPHDEHGVTSYLNKRQLNDLIEFLKTL